MREKRQGDGREGDSNNVDTFLFGRPIIHRLIKSVGYIYLSTASSWKKYLVAIWNHANRFITKMVLETTIVQRISNYGLNSSPQGHVSISINIVRLAHALNRNTI
jgi:hypothetical protein